MLPLVKAWTQEDLDKLKRMALSGSSPIRCAAALRRSSSSVRAKARELGTPFRSLRETRKLLNAAQLVADDDASKALW